MSIIEEKHQRRYVAFEHIPIYEHIFEELKANGIQPNEEELKERINQTVDFLLTKTPISKNYDQNVEQQKEDIERLKHYIFEEEKLAYKWGAIEHSLGNTFFKYFNFNEYLALDLLKELHDAKNTSLPFELSPFDKTDSVIVNEIIEEFNDRRNTKISTFQFLHQRQIANFLVEKGIYGDVDKLEDYVKEQLQLVDDTQVKAETRKVIQEVFGNEATFHYFAEDHHARAKNPLYQLDRELLARHGDFTKDELDYLTYGASNEEIVEELGKLGIQFTPVIPQLDEGEEPIYADYIFNNGLDGYEIVDTYDDWEDRTFDDLIPYLDGINSAFIMTHAIRAELEYTFHEKLGIEIGRHELYQLAEYMEDVQIEEEVQEDAGTIHAKKYELIKDLEEHGVHIDLDKLTQEILAVAKDIDVEAMSRIGQTTFCPVKGEEYDLAAPEKKQEFISDFVYESITSFIVDKHDFFKALSEEQKKFVMEESDFCYNFDEFAEDVINFDEFVEDVIFSCTDGSLILDYSNEKLSISDTSTFCYAKKEKYQDLILAIDQDLCKTFGYQHGIEEYVKAEYEKANIEVAQIIADNQSKFYFAKVEENKEKRQLEIEELANEKEEADLQKSEEEKQVEEVDNLQEEEDILIDEKTFREAFSEFIDEDEDLDL